MDKDLGAQWMIHVFAKRQSIFSVGVVEAARPAVDRHHRDLAFSPFLHVRVRQGHHHVARPLHRHGSGHLSAIHVDGEIRGEPLEVRLPAGRILERLAQQRARPGVVLDFCFGLLTFVRLHRRGSFALKTSLDQAQFQMPGIRVPQVGQALFFKATSRIRYPTRLTTGVRQPGQ